jgi:hypothetical protein
MLYNTAGYAIKESHSRAEKETRMRPQLIFRWILLLAIVAAATLSHQPSSARADQAASPSAVIAWNGIATRAVVDPIVAGQFGAGMPPAHSMILVSYVQAAVYNAVVAIEGGYEPYHSTLAHQPGASVDAAVAAAAHDVLGYYLPLQQSLLDTEYNNALAAITPSPGKTAGIALGQAAALELITLRQGDGLGVTYNYPLLPPGPGVWTPPANGGLTPWVAVMRPFLISNFDQFRPGPPLRLNHKQWVTNYNELLSLGRSNSVTRTPEQTDAARFWTDNPARQNNKAFTAIIQAKGLDAVQAARLYAMVNMVNADAAIACWDAKYHYQFWRPGPAIVGDDGNPATVSDPTWTPLLGTPPHPEYPSGHGCVTSSLAEVFTHVLGKQINVDITSVAAGVIQTTRHFATAEDLRTEIIDVRIWSGIHYRDSDEVGVKMGQKVARWALERYFLKQAGN